MANQDITVVYQWKAKEGKFDELKAIYEAVSQESKENEPGIKWLNVNQVTGTNALVIQEVFEDGKALAFHLESTAGKFFPKLMEVADFGPFFIFGDVPEEIVQATKNMNMGAIVSKRAFGFIRNSSENE